MRQPLDRDRHVERNSLDVTRWESGGGGMVSTISDFARYGQMLLNGGTLDVQTLSRSPTAFAAMTTDHIGPGSGVARDFYYYPGDGFGFGYGFGVRTDPATWCRRRPASLGEIKWDGATGVYIAGRPRSGHVFRSDGRSSIRTNACAGDAEEDCLRRVRQIV